MTFKKLKLFFSVNNTIVCGILMAFYTHQRTVIGIKHANYRSQTGDNLKCLLPNPAVGND